MPFSIDIHASERIIAIRGRDPATLQDILATIEELAATLRDHPGYRILSDQRELQYEPPMREVLQVASAMYSHRLFVKTRFAHVVRPGVQLRLANIYSALGHYAGAQIEAFVDPDEAMQWLSEK